MVKKFNGKHLLSAKFFFSALLILATLCLSAPFKVGSPSEKRTRQQFRARPIQNEQDSPYIYTALVPNSWKLMPLKISSDTKEPICQFMLPVDGLEPLIITVHTFPFEDPQMRIPHFMQVQRWQEKFENGTETLKRASHGGFSGLMQLLKKKDLAQISWTMALDQEHCYTILSTKNQMNKYYLADFTVKAWGSQPVIEQKKNEIEKFVQSFGFIDPIIKI